MDDNADGANSLAMLLSLAGHHTETANSGPAALDAVARSRPDVVILDIGLPGMDGYAVAQTIRADDRLGRPVLVAATGWGSEKDRKQATAAGFDHHLIKPVDGLQLERLFQEALDSR